MQFASRDLSMGGCKAAPGDFLMTTFEHSLKNKLTIQPQESNSIFFLTSDNYI